MSVWNNLKGLLGNGTSRAIGASSITAPGAGSRGAMIVQMGGSSVSAFGDLITAENTPLFQYDFVNCGTSSTFNTQLMTQAQNGSGALVDVTNGRLRIQSGTVASNYAYHKSTKVGRYRAGQGITARFTYAFTNSAAGSIHLAGPANTHSDPPLDGYFFAYIGTTFGILHRCQYFTDGVAFSGAGYLATDHFVAKTAWNVDVCDGSNSANNPSGYTLTPGNSQVYQIRYPYLGSGDITFWVLNGTTGMWILVHLIQYAGSSVIAQLGNPSLNFYAGATNVYNGVTSTTNLLGYCGSVAMLLSGTRVYAGPQFGADSFANAKNATTTESPFLSLACATTVNGVANRGMIRLRQLSVVTAGNQILAVRMRRNQPLNTALAWQAVNGTQGGGANTITTLTAAQSVAFVDTACTAFTTSPPTSNPGLPGTSNIMFNMVAGPATPETIDLTPYDIFLIPGDFLTVSLVAAGNTNSAVAINWQEDT